jgi:uncharacterized coiled-coil protein SlyX
VSCARDGSLVARITTRLALFLRVARMQTKQRRRVMEEGREPNRMETEAAASSSHATRWLAIGVVALIAALGLTLGYVYRQQTNANRIVSHESEMSATISQMQTQIDSLTAKLNQATAPPAPSAAAAHPRASRATPRRRTATENGRLKDLQAVLADQQKQLKDTQDQVARTRSDFEARLNSTRDDLNGSIARTHDELVALEQKGERNYYEFDLWKSKQFEHAGPVMISLRKTDAKHKHYDLAMVVDDNQLSKKNVNLYEPVWINGSDMQQLQLVVNRVDKNHVHGYVSAPKYNQPVSFTAQPAASMTPVSARTNGASSTSQAGTNRTSSPTTP